MIFNLKELHKRKERKRTIYQDSIKNYQNLLKYLEYEYLGNLLEFY